MTRSINNRGRRYDGVCPSLDDATPALRSARRFRSRAAAYNLTTTPTDRPTDETQRNYRRRRRIIIRSLLVRTFRTVTGYLPPPGHLPWTLVPPFPENYHGGHLLRALEFVFRVIGLGFKL